MRKIVTLLVLLSVCTFAFATEGRVNGLGVNPIFYDDDYLFTIFPQYISNYMNNAYIDAYYYSSYYDKTEEHQYSGGLNFKLLGNDFGLYMNKDFPVEFEYEYAKLDKALNLYMALGGLGIGLDVAMDHYKTDYYPGGNLEENTLGLGGKVGLEIGGFDVAGHVYFATGKSKQESVEELKDNALFIYGATRMKMFETEKSVVYPGAELVLGTWKETVTYLSKSDEEDEFKVNMFGVQPGIGLNHWLTDEVLVIAAASCGFFQEKYDISYGDTDTTYNCNYDYRWVTLPKLELGLEAYLAKWLTVRAGINKEYYYYSYEGDEYDKSDYELSTYDSDFYYSFGLGLEFGRFTIDWEICEDLLWNAPYIVTGNESEFAGSFSLKYSFK